MIKEQELKNKCTPEFTKWMCEYAEGFELFYDEGLIIIDLNDDEFYIEDNNFLNDFSQLPLLIHRAIEGWNKKYPQHTILVYSNGLECWSDSDNPPMSLDFKDYESNNLTQAECAMLHCLLDVFKQEEGDENNI